jgi:hypothetical protein
MTKMETDLARFEPTLRLYEEDLKGFEDDKERLRTQILSAQSELKRIAVKRVKRLHMSAVTKEGLGLPLTDEEKQHLTVSEEATLIPADAFKGMKLLKAAEAYLIWRGETMTHRELQDGLLAGGLEVQLKNLDNSLRSAMQRSGKFIWFKDSDKNYRWALPHWIDRSPNETEVKGDNEKRGLAVVGGTEAIVKTA